MGVSLGVWGRNKSRFRTALARGGGNMKSITGFFYDIVDWGTELLQALPGFLWEHKMWLVVLIPVAGLYGLKKVLWP